MEKKKRFSEGLLCVALLVGVVFGTVAGAAIYASAYPVFQSDNWASWAAAIATFSAAGVALWLGLGEMRRRDFERAAKAEILAAALMPLLEQTRNMVQYARLYAERGYAVMGAEDTREALSHMLSNVQNVSLPSDILTLGNLSTETSKSITSTQSKLQALCLDMTFKADLIKNWCGTDAIQKEIFNDWSATLLEIEGALLKIMSSLEIDP